MSVSDDVSLNMCVVLLILWCGYQMTNECEMATGGCYVWSRHLMVPLRPDIWCDAFCFEFGRIKKAAIQVSEQKKSTDFSEKIATVDWSQIFYCECFGETARASFHHIIREQQVHFSKSSSFFTICFCLRFCFGFVNVIKWDSMEIRAFS